MISSINRALRVTAFLFLAVIISPAQKPELVVQTGHSNIVFTVAFSPDGKTLASGSGDNTVKLWDVSTGTELRTLKLQNHTVFQSVSPFAFSPDGKTLATGSSFTVELWDVSSGAELLTFEGHHSRPVSVVAFSPSGKILATGSREADDTVKLWDVSSGTELRTLKGHSKGIRSVAFSPDGKTLASGSDDETVKLWDVSTGAELHTLKGHSRPPPPPLSPPSDGSGVSVVAFSPNGKTLASGSDDKTMKLWDVSTGAELSTLKGHSEGVSSVAFSPDGKTLASGGLDGVKLWGVSTGAELSTLKGYSDGASSVAFSPDGKTLATGGFDHTIKLLDVSSGTELLTFKGHSKPVFSVAFSPNGKTLASDSIDEKQLPGRQRRASATVRLWDLSTGAGFRSLRLDSPYPSRVTFSPDGKTLATGSYESIVLWEVASGAELRTFNSTDLNPVESMAFSPNGKTLASANGYHHTVKLWDVSTGAELRTLKGHSNSVQSIAFSPDGKTLASGDENDTIKLWDVSTGAELRTLKGRFEGLLSVGFSPNGKTLASGSRDHTVTLWDVSTGTELRTLEGHSTNARSLAFSPDGKTVASDDLGGLEGGGMDNNTIKLWEPASGRELHTPKAHSSFVSSVAFSPDSKTLASGSEDGRINLWDVGGGNNLATLIALDEKDWLVVTPDGLFDGSPAAWNQILWRFNNNTFNYAPAEAFFNEFYYPGLLSEIMAGKKPKPPKKDLSAVDIRQPQVRITRVGGQAVIQNTPGLPATVTNPAGGRKVAVTLEITDNVKVRSRTAHPKTSGAQDVRLFRNGSLVKLWPGDAFAKESQCQQLPVQDASAPRRSVCTITVPIVAGENRLTAYAFNSDNVKSSDAALTITGAESLKRPGVAYILAVGVNEYANTQYNLKYAVADAQDFAAELKLQQAKLNNYERVEVISLNDREATKANILKSLTDLSAKVQPEDALVIFFAGHGTAQQNRFYLIPHDLGYAGSRTQLDSAALQNILSHSISDEEISRAVEGIDAGQMLLVIDACNSGQALEAEEKRRGPMNSKGLAQLAYEKGMYILTAAQSYQAANEAERYGHGFLTYALVEEGLKTGAADREPKDGQVLLREWLDFATDRVPQMQQDKLDEQQKLGRQLDRIKFAEADAGSERSIQRPRVFYRRETETHPLVVAKP